jgi:uncharacterized membrane protein YhaH (DUF805 family)
MRTDYGPNKLSLRLAIRPFTDMFEFRGRSTRTEVVSFWLLGLLAGLFRVQVDVPMRGFFAFLAALWALIWLWPWIPLLVRRLHDQDRSGRWAFLNIAAAMLAAAIWYFAPAGDGPSLNLDFGPFQAHRSIGWTILTVPSLAVEVVIWLTLLVFYLLPPSEGDNRYGLDPRLDRQQPLTPAET